MRLWLLLACLIALAIELTLLGERSPAPKPASAPAADFSAHRAMPILTGLTDLGFRVSGTPNERAAAEQLRAKLQQIPGLEIEVQEASGARQYQNTPFPYPVFVYRTVNVLARLPGRSRDAILLDAHFDTTGTSLGAGDDAYGVAAVVESLRALASEPQRERSIIALLNGGEEYGLRGADGFTHHPWARDVRAYIYLDGMARGKPRLLQTSAGHPELLEAYARSAPGPSVNILMQDILDHVNIGADGDFRPLQEAGMIGLSLASIDDLASAHTSRDRPERVNISSLQHMGDTTLALARTLADSPPPSPSVSPSSRGVYFDVLGQWVVRYSPKTALYLNLAGLCIAGIVLLLAMKQGRVHTKTLFLGLLWTTLAQLAALLAALLTAVLLAFIIQRPQGFYTRIWLAGVAFPASALAASLGIHALFRRRLRDDGAAPWIVWASALAGWMIILGLFTLAQVGIGYLALVWTCSLALGLLFALRMPRHQHGFLLISLIPGLLVSANLSIPTLGALIPQTGTNILPIPSDPVVAMLVTLPVLTVLPAVMLVGQYAGKITRMAVMALGVSAAGIAALALHPPFDEEHTRRVIATHIETDGHCAIALRAFDALPLDPDLVHVPGVVPAKAEWHPNPPFYPDPTHEVPAAVPGFALPQANVLENTAHADGTRSVKVRLVSATPYLYVMIPRGRLIAWSLTPALPAEPAGGDRDMALYSGLKPEGEELRLEIRGAEPVAIELRSSIPMPGEALDKLLSQLPKHIVFWPEVARTARFSL